MTDKKTRDAIMIFGYRGGGQVRGLNKDKKGAKIFQSRVCGSAYLVAAGPG